MIARRSVRLSSFDTFMSTLLSRQRQVTMHSIHLGCTAQTEQRRQSSNYHRCANTASTPDSLTSPGLRRSDNVADVLDEPLNAHIDDAITLSHDGEALRPETHSVRRAVEDAGATISVRAVAMNGRTGRPA